MLHNRQRLQQSVAFPAHKLMPPLSFLLLPPLPQAVLWAAAASASAAAATRSSTAAPPAWPATGGVTSPPVQRPLSTKRGWLVRAAEAAQGSC